MFISLLVDFSWLSHLKYADAATSLHHPRGWRAMNPILVSTIAHRRVRQVAIDAAVQSAHRIVVPLVGLHLEDRAARVDGLHDVPRQAGNRRRE
jgi:hypothetical protein